MNEIRKALVSIIATSTDLLYKTLEKRMPKTGKCSPVGTHFDIPYTNNEGYLSIQCDPTNHDLRLVKTIVQRTGSQYGTMHTHFTGTLDEVVAYLSDKTHEEALVNSLMDLSKSVDDKGYPIGG